jgi:hypothetical protein
MAIESTALRSPFYGSIEPGDRRKPTSPPVDAPSSPDYHTDDMDVDAVIGRGARAWDDHVKQSGSADAVSEQLAAREEQRMHAGYNQELSSRSQPPAWDDHVKQLDSVDGAVERLNSRGEERAHAGYNQEITLKSRPPGLDIYTPKVWNIRVVNCASKFILEALFVSHTVQLMHVWFSYYLLFYASLLGCIDECLNYQTKKVLLAGRR